MQTVKLLSDWEDAQADLSLHWVQSPNHWFCHTVIHIFSRNKHEVTASELKLSLEQNTELKKEIGNREKDLKKLHKEAEVRLLWNSEKDH